MSGKFKLIDALRRSQGDKDENSVTTAIEKGGIAEAIRRKKASEEEDRKRKEAHELRLKRGY